MRKLKTRLLLTILLVLGISPNILAQKGYEKSINIGASVGVGDKSNTAYSLAFVNGYRFNDYFFAGVGAGIGYSNFLNGIDIDKYGFKKEYRTEAYLVPIYANLKTNLSKGKYSPFLSLNIGYTIDANQYLRDAPGFMFEPSFGIDCKLNESQTLYMLAGLNMQNCKYSYSRNLGTTSSDWELSYKTEMLKAISIRLGFKF